MAFSNFELTTLGAALLAKVAAGGTLQFNAVALGSGSWPGGEANPAWSELVDEQIDFPVNSVVPVSAGMATGTAILMHDGLPADGFYAREIGLYAEDPDIGAILFAVAYAGDEASWIPAITDVASYQHVYSIAIAIGNATTLTVQVDPSTVTVSMAQFSAHEGLELDPTSSDTSKNKHLSNAQAKGWETSIGANASAISAHSSQTNPHGSTVSAAAGRMILRDGFGRAKIAAPAESDDIARKADVDAEAASRASADSSHALLTNPHGATSAATPIRIMMRDTHGRAKVAAPASSDDIARKADVDAAIAAGQVIAFAGSAPPSGFLECNGAAVSRSTYSVLFAAIGTAYGHGNGSTTFNLPDLRGEFIRGWDHGRGVDSGRGLGTAQGATMIAERMGNHAPWPTQGAIGIHGSDGEDYDDTYHVATNAAQGTISIGVDFKFVRPRNVAMTYCIRY